MQILASWLLLALVISMALPVFVFCFEIVAAVLLPQPHVSERAAIQRRPRIGVLIPAHNEGAGLSPTVENVKAQLRERDRLLVVADNCSDDTSAVATSLGAEVIERRDPLHVGKGYALDFGIKHLARDPPEIVIMIDADCLLKEGSIETLAAFSAAECRPVQALNLMKAPDGLQGAFEVPEFAWRVKNWARPLGLRALGLPCQLTGTGMAFPWDIIRSACLATGEIVEDLRLGLELAKAGTPAVFCPSASVLSYFPSTQQGVHSQRERWQKGHLSMIATLAPQMLREGMVNRDKHLVILALDLIVPPLFLLALIEAGLLAASMFAVWLGDTKHSFYIALTTNGLFALAIVSCWFRFGRDVMPPKTLLTLPLLIGKKIWFYQHIIFTRGVAQRWIRTDRNKSETPPSEKTRLD